MLTFVTAITAGFFVYHFMFSLTDRMKTSFPTQILELRSVSINSTCITVSVKNHASVNVQILEAYVNGEKYNLSEDVTFSANDVETIHFYGTYIEGEVYTVKITPSLGSALVREITYE